MLFVDMKSIFTRRILMRASIVFLPLSFLLLIGLAGIHHLYESDYIEKIKVEGRRDLLKHKTECSYMLDWAIEDTLWLAEITEKHFLENGVLSDNAEIKQFYSSYGALHPYYDQIRYIDKSGKECIRVNFEKQPVIVPDHMLQDKRDRYYFKEIIGLKKGHIYISPIDLNVEHGQIEQSFKPMIRFSTPLYVSGQFKGVIILNFKARIMLDTFEREKLTEHESKHNYLINEHGYILAGSHEPFHWGFIFEGKENHTFSQLFPIAGQQVQVALSGYCKTKNGIFLWETIDPFINISLQNPALKREKVESLHTLKVIYHLSEEDFRAHMHITNRFLLICGIVLTILSIAGGIILACIIEQRRETLKLLKTSEAKAREMAVRAQIADQTKSEFLATISHELRTPLNAIIGFSEVLSEGLNEDQQEFLSEIQTAANRLFKIVESILGFSDIARDHLRLDFDDCVLDDILNKLRFRFHDQIKSKNIDFSIHKNAQVPEQLYTDEIRLYECLENVLDNAAKFTERGHIYLNINLEQDESNHYLRFDVEDTGAGISDQQQNIIGQLFTQADGSDSRVYGGVGMGLVLTSEMIKMLNGDFSFSSRLGKGSVFTIKIPLSKEKVHPEMVYYI